MKRGEQKWRGTKILEWMAKLTGSAFDRIFGFKKGKKKDDKEKAKKESAKEDSENKPDHGKSAS